MKKIIEKIYRSVKHKDIYNYCDTKKLVNDILDDNPQMFSDIKFYFCEKQKRIERGKDILGNNIPIMISIIGLFVSSIMNINEVASSLKLYIATLFTLVLLSFPIVELLLNTHNRLVQGRYDIINKILNDMECDDEKTENDSVKSIERE